MKILMIGNGYDISCGLPTQYKDFLDFCDQCTKYSIPKEAIKAVNEHTIEGDALSVIFKQAKDAVLEERFEKFLCTDKTILSIFWTCIKNNRWLAAFKIACAQSAGDDKHRWVDFEEVISQTIIAIRACLKDCEWDNQNSLLYTLFSDFRGKNISLIKSSASNEIDMVFDISNEEKAKETGKEIDQYLLNELEKLNTALEIYLNYVVNEIPGFPKKNALSMLHPDFVISFNYTNTFQRLYQMIGGKAEYCYIHGRAQDYTDSCETTDNHIVLGIEDFLRSTEDTKEDTQFIRFKKYYQRIYKGTGASYKEWLRNIDHFTVNDQHSQLYIFGHSLAVSDRDIISELILHDKIDTTIFYHSQQQYSSILINLVQIIGRDKLVEMTFSGDPRIKFVDQKLLEDGTFTL